MTPVTDSNGGGDGREDRPGDTAERPVLRVDDAAQSAASGSPLVAAMRAAEGDARGDAAAGDHPDHPAPNGAASADSGAGPKRGRKKFVALGVALAVVLVLVGGYVAAYFVAADKVARGTSVAGVDIGGQTRDDAIATLDDAFADNAERPIAVSVVDSDIAGELDPSSASLALDAEESVDAADGRRSWSPQRLWTYFLGGRDLDAVVTSDEAGVDAFLNGLEQEAGSPPVEGQISFEDGEIAVTEPAPGRGFDDEPALAALEEAFLSDDPSAELTLTDVTPKIDQAAVDAALAEFAEPALSGPVVLRFGDTPVELQPAEYAPALSMVPQNGALVGQVDGEVLRAVLNERVGDPGRPQDATFTIENGAPVVVPAQPGVDYLPETLAEVFTGVVTAPAGSREAEIEAEAVEPEFTTEDAEALGVTEEVSEFTTYYPHANYRNVNIGRAAELINGTLLKPGETFSLNETVGERTEANGFTAGSIIANGVFRDELGGGVSQVATTTFNAAYFAGLEDIEHKPHSLYIDRYPEGREATVAWPTVDLKFKNDTDHGVYIQTVHAPSSSGNRGSLTVKMFSTKIWDIESDVSGRYNFTGSETRTLSTSDCVAQSGSSGFSVDYDRVFRRPGSSEVVKREDFSWTYNGAPTIRCVDPTPDPAPAPAPAPAPEDDPAPPADPEG